VGTGDKQEMAPCVPEGTARDAGPHVI